MQKLKLLLIIGLTLACSCFIINTSMAQLKIYAGPTTGLNFIELNNHMFDQYNLYFGKMGYRNISPYIGISMKNVYNNKYFLSFESSIYQLTTETIDMGIIGWSYFKYSDLQVQASLGLFTFKDFYLSVGTGMSFIKRETNYNYNDFKVRDSEVNRTDIGYKMAAGYSLFNRKLQLELSYLRGGKPDAFLFKVNSDDYSFFHSKNTFSFSISYLFKIVKIEKRNRVNCPGI